MSTPKFLAYLSHQSIDPITRKGWFSGTYVIFDDYMFHSLVLYKICAVLGYTFRDRLMTFVGLFCEPGREADSESYLAKLITSRLANSPKEPQDFMDLFFKTEVERIMKIMRDAGIIKYSEFLDFHLVAK